LYVYRVLLKFIYLMQTGEVNANLISLNDHFRLPYIPDLIERKTGGPEKSVLPNADVKFHAAEFERLRGQLELEQSVSRLREAPEEEAQRALNALLVRVRLTDRILARTTV
jgi:predicted nucleotidyltransferase